jgi:hypothetical protein
MHGVHVVGYAGFHLTIGSGGKVGTGEKADDAEGNKQNEEY